MKRIVISTYAEFDGRYDNNKIYNVEENREYDKLHSFESFLQR